MQKAVIWPKVLTKECVMTFLILKEFLKIFKLRVESWPPECCEVSVLFQ